MRIQYRVVLKLDPQSSKLSRIEARVSSIAYRDTWSVSAAVSQAENGNMIACEIFLSPKRYA